MKNLKNLGKALSKAEQKTINGSGRSCNGHPWLGQPCIGGSGYPLSCPTGLVCDIASDPVDSICVCP